MKFVYRLFWERVRTWVPFVIGIAVLSIGIGSMGLIPTGDAPHLLAISDKLARMLGRGEFLEAFEAWSSLVTPHPPAGFGVPVVGRLAGFGNAVPIVTSFVGLGLAWHGMILLSRVVSRASWGPWMGALLMFSMPATWSFVAHMAWDVLAAGCVTACIGHLHASDGFRNKGHALAFGAFMGLGFVTKYTFPAFLWLPVFFAGVAVYRFQAWSGLAVAMGAFLVMAGPWLITHGDSMLAYVLSSSGATATISASPASAWSARFSPDNLLFYPTVLRDMVGWPGIALLLVAVGFAWRRPAGRWALWSVLGGGLMLTFAGENQARYIYPAIPLLGVVLDVGIRPGFGSSLARFGLVSGLCAMLPAVWGGWVGIIGDTEAPPTRDQTHAAESLLGWGEWPWAAIAFRPVSNPLEAWKVDAALAAIADETGRGAHQVGMLLPRDARMPPGSSYAWRAGQRGLDWDVATIVPSGPTGDPMVFVGPLKPLGDRISRRFQVAYAVHPKGAPPAIIMNLDGQIRWQQELPFGMQGSVFRIPNNVWNTPTGLLLQKDPLDG